MYACIMKSIIGANGFSVDIEKFALERSSSAVQMFTNWTTWITDDDAFSS